MYYEKLIIGALSLGLLPIILLHFKKKKYQALLSKLDEHSENVSYKFIFVTYKNFHCSNHIYKNTFCGKTCSNTYLHAIVDILSSSKYSISLCVLHLTLRNIYETLIDAHKRNINVRIICDRQMAKSEASKISTLRDAGLKIKIPPKDSSMVHHKFCLIDESDVNSAKLLFGSMNLTLQGFCNNWDNIVITNDSKIIATFKQGFEDMWNIF